MVSLRAIPPEDIRPGDIAALEIDGELRLHRILAVDRRDGALHFREKGDNELFSRWVPAGHYRGRAAWLFAGSRRRSLSVDSGSFRVRSVTRLSRFEADIFEFLRRLPGSNRDRPLPGGRLMVRTARVLLTPLKILLSPLVFSIYGSSAKEGESAEYRLLLQCIRERSSTEAGGHGKPSAERIDPHLFLHAASSHGVAAVIAEILEAGGIPREIGGEINAEIRLLHQQTALQSIGARLTVTDISEAFDRAKIDYAILKGPSLSVTLYSSGSLRPMCDIDVLVRRSDRDKGLAALEEKGYRGKARGLVGRLLLWGHFHSTLTPKDKGRLPVELHWAPVDRANLYRLPEDELFERLAAVRAGERTFTALSAEDTLLYLCLHVAKHGLLNKQGLQEGRAPEWFCLPETGNRLIWFLDLHLFLRAGADLLQWEKVRERIDRWNITEDVAVSLGVLQKLFPDSRAAEIITRIGLPNITETGGGRGLATSVARPLLRRSMSMDRRLFFRPARFFFVGKLFFPERETMRRFYGTQKPLLLLYLAHPFVMAARLLGFSRSRRDA